MSGRIIFQHLLSGCIWLAEGPVVELTCTNFSPWFL